MGFFFFLSLLIQDLIIHFQKVDWIQMDSNSNPLNLKKIKELIQTGISRIPKDPNCNEAVIVIGDTGVGKSTMLSFLAGAELFVRYDKLKPYLDCPENIVKIGHGMLAETGIPNKLVIDKMAFYDCPGFKDNKGEEVEISNSFFVQRLLDIYPKVKIVLMIDDSHISEARADKLPKLTNNLLRSFKTFEDIKEGVIVIVNKAQPDLSVYDYHRELKKMLQLKTERGFLFQLQQQQFLRYLMQNNRIVLFRHPRKQDKDKKFIASDVQRSIMPAIKRCSFVKSKHILNILSESAKLAIRDFIDEITNRSNSKIETICKEIVNLYMVRVTKIGKNVKELVDMKGEIIALAENIRSAQKEDIIDILKGQLENENAEQTRDFTEDFESVMFFKHVYDKTATYFSNLVNKIYSQLTHLLVKMDHRILKVQKEEQEQVQRQRQIQHRKQLHEQRERERQEMAMQMQKMKELKNQISQMSNSSCSMKDSLSETMNYLNSLQNLFLQLKQEAGQVSAMNRDMMANIVRIESVYVKKGN